MYNEDSVEIKRQWKCCAVCRQIAREIFPVLILVGQRDCAPPDQHKGLIYTCRVRRISDLDNKQQEK